MRKVLKIVILICAGIFTCLLLLEISLRIFGSFYHSKVSPSAYKKTDSYTILTFGDSYTFGVGSKDGMTYPFRLEQMLNSGTNKKFKVINLGLNGENSAQVVENLEAQINRYHPDLAIFLTGGADFWNFYGYHKPLNNFLYNIKVFRLFKLIIKNLDEKEYLDSQHTVPGDIHEYLLNNENRKYINISNRYRFYTSKYKSPGAVYMKLRAFDKAIKWFREQSKKDRSNYVYTEGIVYSYLLLERNDEAIRCLSGEIGKDPGNVRLYSLMGFVYSIIADYKNAEKCLEKGVSINEKYGVLYYQLAMAYYHDNNIPQSDKWLSRGLGIEPLCYDFIRFLKENGQIKKFTETIKAKNDQRVNYDPGDYARVNDTLELNRVFLKMGVSFDSLAFIDVSKMSLNNNYPPIFRWLRSDIEKIISICTANRLKVMFMNYPVDHFPHPDMPANYLLNDFFELHNDIPFVNNEMIFIKNGKIHPEYFVKDGHCSNLGYELMAKNVFEKIISANIFDVDTNSSTKNK